MSRNGKLSLQLVVDEKRTELQNLNEIKRFTEILTDQLEQLEEKLDTMSDGAETAALVFSNWQNVMKSVSLASLGLMKYSQKDYEEQKPLPECLVRIKLDKEEPES